MYTQLKWEEMKKEMKQFCKLVFEWAKETVDDKAKIRCYSCTRIAYRN